MKHTQDMKTTRSHFRDFYRTALIIEKIKIDCGQSKHTTEEIDQELQRINEMY